VFLAAHSILGRLYRRPGLTFDIYGHLAVCDRP